MIDGSEKRNRQLAFELENSHVCEKRSKVDYDTKYIFVKTWPLGFRLALCKARVQASPASKIVGGLLGTAGFPRDCPNSWWVDQARGSKLVG